jgi:predicted PurR-regulated permease PerM
VLPPEGVVHEREDEERYRLLPGRRSDDERPGSTARLIAQAREVGAGHAADVVRIGRGVVGSIIGGVFGFFITLMLSAYMLLHEAAILGFFKSLLPPQVHDAYDELLERIDRGLSGVVRGQLMICAVNGVLSAVGFAIARLPYWPLLALLAAVLSIIPIFGSILSSVPAVAIGLQQGVGHALFVLGWILGIHQLEANVLNPKIMGDAAKINPVLVVFSLLAGEHFFGILGALLAVPTMSIVQSVFLHWRKYALRYDAPVDPDAPSERDHELEIERREVRRSG